MLLGEGEQTGSLEKDGAGRTQEDDGAKNCVSEDRVSEDRSARQGDSPASYGAYTRAAFEDRSRRDCRSRSHRRRRNGCRQQASLE